MKAHGSSGGDRRSRGGARLPALRQLRAVVVGDDTHQGAPLALPDLREDLERANGLARDELVP
ncbi:hypothetical protein SAMN05421688_1750 [Poseidonocella pacifica]|uniref:Uncharacterized protein n=1 Tax=Poseidonocella pacifica TaxID=871651 RepID=A0A1I0WUY5_9RHOB|nr:hypothetical protein SAMN05421688_1750 [Poseidonocella pacifica]